MNDWPIGLSTGCFHDTSIFECLPLIRESGFSMIEVCFSAAHLDYRDVESVRRAAGQIAELGMEAYSFHAPFAPHIDISSPDAAQREVALGEIVRAAEAASILRVRYFVIHPGPEQAGARPPEERLQRMESTVLALDQLAQRCRDLGIICVLENKLPHLLFGNASDVLWILQTMKSINVGACLDTGHAYLSGDLSNLVHKLAGHLKMIHAHDNGGGGDDHQPPGDGRIDWEQLLGELARTGFAGAFILELAGSADRTATLANARRGRSHLRDIIRRASLAAS